MEAAAAPKRGEARPPARGAGDAAAEVAGVGAGVGAGVERVAAGVERWDERPVVYSASAACAM